MEDLEPELLIIEEHEYCRKSNEIQFLLSKQCIPYWKITLGARYVRLRGHMYQLPCIFLGELKMGGLRELNDFVSHSKVETLT